MRRRAAPVDVEEARLRSWEPAAWLTPAELVRVAELAASFGPGVWCTALADDLVVGAALPANVLAELRVLAGDEDFDPGWAVAHFAAARAQQLTGSAAWSWALVRCVTRARRRVAVLGWAQANRVNPRQAREVFGVLV